MTDATQQQLISDIAHEVITEIAPRELLLFRVTSKTFFDTENLLPSAFNYFSSRRRGDSLILSQIAYQVSVFVVFVIVNDGQGDRTHHRHLDLRALIVGNIFNVLAQHIQH